jgi:hypothetical protein
MQLNFRAEQVLSAKGYNSIGLAFGDSACARQNMRWQRFTTTDVFVHVSLLQSKLA